MFWLISLLLVFVALAFVLPPLLGRNPRRWTRQADTRAQWNLQVLRERLRILRAEHAEGVLGDEDLAQAERELEHEALASGGGEGTLSARRSLPAATAVAVVVPVLAFGIYLWLGSPGALQLTASGEEAEMRAQQQNAEQLVGRLAARLQAEPSDGQGWLLLGRTYVAMGRFQDAVAALDNAVQRLGREPGVLLDYAEARALAGGNRFDERSLAMIDEALSQQPDNPKGLWLKGMAEFERNNFGQAAGTWERLLAVLPAQAPERAQVRSALQLAQERSGTAVPAASPGEGSAITVTVRIEPGLAERVRPGDTLFVYARAPQGPRVPLAVSRTPVGELPRTLRLDDSMAMMPERNLSSADQVVLVARISRSGNAIPAAGDLYGETGPLEPSSTGSAELVIDSEMRGG